MSGAGNDFIVVQTKLKGYSRIAQELCQKKTGIGADGLLVLEESKKADFKMRIFNADGSEAEMCGNGLRCAALYFGKKGKVRIETIAGMYEAQIMAKDMVKVKMEVPKDLKRDLTIKVNSRNVKVGYLDTGVPHAVIFVQGIDDINVDSIGRNIRYHAKFKPRGANVDFVEVVDDENIKMRTYERGVEGETLACGTGAVASAIISGFSSRGSVCKINVHTKGGVLKVYFKKSEKKIKDVYLEGKTRKVFKGEVNYV